MDILVAIPLVCIVIGIGLGYAHILRPMVGWAMSALGILFGFGVSIFIFLAHVRVGDMHLLGYAILAALPFIVAVPMVIKDLRYPRINDVTTDLVDPPSFQAALAARANIGRNMAYPAPFIAIMRAGYPHVQPLILDEPPSAVMQRAAALIADQPNWVVGHRDAATLEGAVTTSVFRFVDDYVIRITAQDGKTRVDMRSKSRDGLVDAGANARRILSFFAQLEQVTGR